MLADWVKRNGGAWEEKRERGEVKKRKPWRKNSQPSVMEEHEKKEEKWGEVKKSKPWREEKGENQNGEP
jgi:hypothetical protein